MPEAILRLADVGFTYGSGDTALTVLRHINLALDAGSTTLLLGPSGSGKTTLLQIMGCLLRPTTGRAELFGENLSAQTLESLTALRLRHFGFVFQHYHLFPTLRAWENVAIAMHMKGQDAQTMKARSLQLLSRLQMADKAMSYPAHLSGGQKQRVAIARALAGSPAIILADEPTAALDGKTGQEVMQILHGLARAENAAIVVVSHDPRMLPFADRVIHLEDGMITSDETKSDNQNTGAAQ